MNVYLAGATGTIGRPSINILVARGHRVFAMTRRVDLQNDLRKAGAVPVVVDVFDMPALGLALCEAKPDAIIHQLTDLALLREPTQLEEALRRNAHLRKVGTANLVAAALGAGVQRIVAQSIAWVYESGGGPHDEEAALDLEASGARGVSVEGVAALEHAVLHTPGIAGCVLRYGQLYGPGTGSADASGKDVPLHVEAAAWAAVLALEKRAVGTYNVAEPNSYARTEKIKRDLGWRETLRA